ncbi:MAG: hypothetical protein CM1200mP2_05870 [Planctomycetaceae bacterium]|nr:MAG: hypothetical protein CM1200mP2_05870 [Planctomycetaceae bacterium]
MTRLLPGRRHCQSTRRCGGSRCRRSDPGGSPPYVAVPVVFAIVACVVPWRMAFSSSTLQNTVGQRETQELVQLLEELKEAGVLEQQEQEKLDEEIQKLAEDTTRGRR